VNCGDGQPLFVKAGHSTLSGHTSQNLKPVIQALVCDASAVAGNAGMSVPVDDRSSLHLGEIDLETNLTRLKPP